jgi:hypothetical protein
LNVNNFKMVEAMGLKMTALRPSWTESPPYQFHENLPICSKVISGRHRHTETNSI